MFPSYVPWPCQEEYDDEDDWNPCKAAGVCLSLMASCCENDIVLHVLPFVDQHLQNMDWKFRDAAVMALGVLCVCVCVCVCARVHACMRMLCVYMYVCVSVSVCVPLAVRNLYSCGSSLHLSILCVCVCMCICAFVLLYVHVLSFLSCPGSILEGPEPGAMNKFIHEVSCLHILYTVRTMNIHMCMLWVSE